MKTINKKKLLIAGISVVIVTAIALIFASRSTCLKYNDWWIVGNSIENVRDRYGEFTRGMYGNYNCDGDFGDDGGIVGYFIYVDNAMVMPSHQPQYYWIKYNSDNIVEEVFVDTVPGG